MTILVWAAFSCSNDEWEFPDFDYATTYFPYQYPIRTLVLGDYFFDNTNDNDLKFLISARVGGMRENNSNWTVNYQLDPTLVNKLATNANLFDGKTTSTPDTLAVLPSQYYTLAPASELVVPKGTFIGSITVQLTDAFLDDPLAAKTKYVIPLRITESTTDSILKGKTDALNPDARIPGQWTIVPKNFTIFGIKFVNPYHGKYLHRGISIIQDTATSTYLDTIVYRQKYVEKDELWAVQTTGRKDVVIKGATLRMSPSSPGKFNMKLTFDNSNNCVITTGEGSTFQVSGNGKFVPDGDMWGNLPQDAIHLDYTVVQAGNKHRIKDTLVFRDKAVTYLEYTPVILP